MPNNKDAVMLPIFEVRNGNELWVSTDKSKVYSQIITSEVVSAMNAATSREEKLEAQNKALWELVDSLEYGLARIAMWVDEREVARYSNPITTATLCRPIVSELIASIQKAKEGITHG